MTRNTTLADLQKGDKIYARFAGKQCKATVLWNRPNSGMIKIRLRIAYFLWIPVMFSVEEESYNSWRFESYYENNFD